MTEWITMNRQETERLSRLKQVEEGMITQLKAAELLGIKERQVRNLLTRLKTNGPQGIISKHRGHSSNRKKDPQFKKHVLSLVYNYYNDFGPTLAAEKLVERHGIIISDETLRQWMIEAHIWIPKVRKKKIHPLRKPKEYFGEMIQGDGSHHDWFENGEKCTLLVFEDDATRKITAARFFSEETLDGYFEMLHLHVDKYGVPISLYTDRFSVFETSTKKENLTQFRRALNALGITWIGALSPEAKGKVERCNRILQDRLVKEMRLEGIRTMEEANRFIDKYIEIHNHKFSKEPMKVFDLHRPLERGLDLSRILSKYEERTLTKDLLFQFNSKHYKIVEANREQLPGKKLEIRISQQKQMRVFDGNQEIRVQSLEESYESEKKRVDLKDLWHTKHYSARSIDHPWKGPSYRKQMKGKAEKTYSVL
jgi:hypothetical protein